MCGIHLLKHFIRQINIMKSVFVVKFTWTTRLTCNIEPFVEVSAFINEYKQRFWHDWVKALFMPDILNVYLRFCFITQNICYYNTTNELNPRAWYTFSYILFGLTMLLLAGEHEVCASLLLLHTAHTYHHHIIPLTVCVVATYSWMQCSSRTTGNCATRAHLCNALGNKHIYASISSRHANVSAFQESELLLQCTYKAVLYYCCVRQYFIVFCTP